MINGLFRSMSILEKKSKLEEALGPLPVVVVEKFQNWGETQTSEVLSVQPRSVKELQRVVVAAKHSGLRIRCLGRGHSWSPIFTNDGEICVYMRDVENEEGWRIKLNQVRTSMCVGIGINIGIGIDIGVGTGIGLDIGIGKG